MFGTAGTMVVTGAGSADVSVAGSVVAAAVSFIIVVVGGAAVVAIVVAGPAVVPEFMLVKEGLR